MEEFYWSVKFPPGGIIFAYNRTNSIGHPKHNHIWYLFLNAILIGPPNSETPPNHTIFGQANSEAPPNHTIFGYLILKRHFN